MKNKLNLRIPLVILAFTCGSTLTLLAQSDLSAKFGVNGTWITTTSFDNYDLRPGFTIGLIAKKVIISEFLSVQLETGISNENSRGHVEIAISEATHAVNLDYWNSAFMTDFQFMDGLKVHGGLQYGYLILARSEFNRNEVVKSANVTSYQFNRHNWSLLIGIEKQLTGQLTLGARYAHGLTHISPYSFSDLVVFNATPPEAFLQHIRTGQVYIRRMIFNGQTAN